LNEAIENYDLAINIRKPLVEDEGRKELANDLAAAYMNKGVALRGLGRSNEAIENYDLAINILKPLVEDEGRKELTDDLAMAFANKANVLAQQENFKEAADYFDASANLWMDAVQSGLIHLLPNLMKLFPMTVGLLVQIEDWNRVAEKILLAFGLLQFSMENDIPDSIKENTGQEFARLLFTLCQTSQENREKIYEACGNADVVRETVEGFCKSEQGQ
jgi:tetratricopeptide (TPR) repeat protein